MKVYFVFFSQTGPNIEKYIQQKTNNDGKRLNGLFIKNKNYIQ